MIILYIVGIILMSFGVLSFISLYKIDEDDLPAPKEQMLITSMLIILAGIFSLTLARITDNFIDAYFNKPQNTFNIIR